MSEGIIMTSDRNTTIEKLRAEVAAFEANPVDPGAPDAATTQAVNANAPETSPEKAALPEPEKTPPAEETAKPTQQPQETAEKVASETKAAEPMKEPDWKTASQSLYKTLQRKMDEVDKERQRLQATPAATQPLEEKDILSPEFKQKFVADLEKDPVEALVRLSRAISRQEVMPIKSKFEATEAAQLEADRLSSLDRLAKEGHEWLKTGDGLRKMETALSENPELWKTKDPYRAALGFIPDLPSKTGQRGPAQSTGLTPMLGASGAVPPSVSAPAVSKMAKLESLNEAVGLAQSRGQWDQAKKLLAEMDQLERGY